MVFMAILSVVGVSTHLIAFSFPVPGLATGLRSAIPVYWATTGRPCQLRTAATATARGSFPSIRATTARTTATAATSGSLFVPFKGSPNSEHKRTHSILFDGSPVR